MSSSESHNSTPGQTLSNASEAVESTTIKGGSSSHEIEARTESSKPELLLPNPEPLSVLAESQRLKREMLRIESEGLELAVVPPTQRSDVSPVPLSLSSPTRTRVQLLESELLDNKRKVASLQESNQRHQKLAQTLQTQLTQSKRKNTDLEMEIVDLKMELQKKAKKLQSKEIEHDSRLDARENMAKMREESLIAELENLTSALESERNKSAELSKSNEVLQEQLEEAAAANQGLSRDVGQLTAAWRGAVGALERREAEWRDEAGAFDAYFAAEHQRLLALWRHVVALRRAFAELRHSSARDFTQMNTDIMRMGQSLQSACSSLAANLKAAELESADALAKSQRQLLAEEADAKARSQSLSESLARSQARLADAEGQIMQLNRRIQDLLTEVSDKDRVLNTLRRLRATVPIPKMSETEGDSSGEDPITVTKKLIEQTHAMHQALSQIAQTVLADTTSADADEEQEPFLAIFQQQLQTGDWGDWSDGVLATPRDSRRQRRPRSTSPTASEHRLPRPTATQTRSLSADPPTKLAETTVTAVRTALNRRAMQVQGMRLKLTSLRGRLEGLNKRCAEGEEERNRLSGQTTALRNDLDLARKEAEAIRIEREKLKHALSLAAEERGLLERTRATSAEQAAALQREVEQFRRLLADAARERDAFSQQAETRQLQLEAEIREKTRLERALGAGAAREASLRSDLDAARAATAEVERRCSAISDERSTAAAECERALSRITELVQQLEASQKANEGLQEKITSLETLLEVRDREKADLSHRLGVAASVEAQSAEERQALRAEAQSLRGRVARAEAAVAEAEAAAGARLREAAARAEAQRSAAEAEALRADRERAEVADEAAALARRVSALTEEAEGLQREITQQATAVARLNEEREELIRDKEELAAKLSLVERERHQLSDLVTKLRTDREVLDNEVFLAQRQITELKNKVEKQETDIANLTLRRNTLQAEVQRVRSDFEAELSKIQRQRDRLGAKYSTELEELRSCLSAAERRLAEAEEAAVAAVVRAERAASEVAAKAAANRDFDRIGERESQRWAEEQARMSHELLVAQRERDDALLRAEQERQKVLALAAEDHATVRERIVLLQETISDLEKTLERTRREATLRAEKDDVALRETTEDLRNCREQLEECKVNHEKEVLSLRAQIKSLESNLEHTTHDFNEVLIQLRLCEESRYSNRSEISETTKLLREAEESRNHLRREVVDQRKQLQELEVSKSNLETTVTDLRRQVRELELERLSQRRSMADMRERLDRSDRESSDHRGVHRAREDPQVTHSRSRDDFEVMELRQRLEEYEANYSRLQQNCTELRTNLGEEITNLEELKRECAGLKKRLTDEEVTRAGLEMELASLKRRHADAEERLRAREWSSGPNSEEASRECKRLEEVRRVLQSRVETSEQANYRLTGDLGSAQRRIHALESDLAACKEIRRDAESRLVAIHKVLRRLLGFRQQPGTTPTLMLRSKQRRAFDDTGIDMTLALETDDGGDRYDHNLSRRSRSISPHKRHEGTDSPSHSSEKRLLLHSTWQDLPARTATGTATMTGVTSSSGDSFVPSALSDLDPEAVAFSLRDLVRQLMQLERERDDAVMAQRVTQQKLLDSTAQLTERSGEVQQLRQTVQALEEEQKSLSNRLRQSHAEVLAKDAEIQKLSKEREVSNVRVEELQRRISLMEEESKAIQDRLDASKAQELKASEEHRKELRKSLEETETRLVASESARRALEADLHRQRSITSDKAVEIKSLKTRLESTQTEMTSLEEKLADAGANIERLRSRCDQATQAELEARNKTQRLTERLGEMEQQNAVLIERLSSSQKVITSMDHDNRLVQERLESTQSRLRECKEQLDQTTNRLQELQNDLSEVSRLRDDLETQNRQLARQNGDHENLQKELTQQIIDLKMEKESAQQKFESLSRSRAECEKSRSELEQEVRELKDKLKEQHIEFEHMIRERLREKELNSVLVSSQEDMRKNLHKLEEENLDHRRHIQRLNAQLALREETHASRLEDLLRQRHAQMEMELEKKTAALQQVERALQAKENTHRHRVKALEEQIRMLNDQLSHESSRRQLYLSTSRLPVTPLSISHYTSMSHLSRAMTHSHEVLTHTPEISRSVEGVRALRSPQLPKYSPDTPTTTTATSVTTTTMTAASQQAEVPSGPTTALSVVVPGESYSEALTPSTRIG